MKMSDAFFEYMGTKRKSAKDFSKVDDGDSRIENWFHAECGGHIRAVRIDFNEMGMFVVSMFECVKCMKVFSSNDASIYHRSSIGVDYDEDGNKMDRRMMYERMIKEMSEDE